LVLLFVVYWRQQVVGAMTAPLVIKHLDVIDEIGPHFRGISRYLVHKSILSSNGVSGKLGAVQELNSGKKFTSKDYD